MSPISEGRKIQSLKSDATVVPIKISKLDGQFHPKIVWTEPTFIQLHFHPTPFHPRYTVIPIFQKSSMWCLCQFGHPPHTSAGCQHVIQTVPLVIAMDTKADAADIKVAGRDSGRRSHLPSMTSHTSQHIVRSWRAEGTTDFRHRGWLPGQPSHSSERS